MPPPTNKSQEQELNIFGFTTDKLRRGLVTGFLGLMAAAIGVLYYQNLRLQKQLVTLQGNLYEKMIGEIRKDVSPAIKQVSMTAQKVDSTAVQVDSVVRALNVKK